MRSAQTGGDTLYSIDLRAGIDAKMRTRTLPPTNRGSRIQVSSTGDGFAVISPSDDGTCSVERLDWTLSTLSDVSLPCDPWRGIDLSRDARLAATVLLSVGEAIEEPGLFSRLTTVSIFDAATGEERLRIKGALPSEALFGVHEGRTRWLSDGSGLVVDTREGHTHRQNRGQASRRVPARCSLVAGLADPRTRSSGPPGPPVRAGSSVLR